MVIQITIDDALIGQLGLADPDSYVRDAVLQRVQQDVFAVQIEQAAQQLQSQVADAVAAGVTVEIQQGSDPKVLAAALEAFDAQAGPAEAAP